MNGTFNLRREQTEPSMRSRSMNNFNNIPIIPRKSSFGDSENIKEEKNEEVGNAGKPKLSKHKLDSSPMKTDFSAFYSNKENRPVAAKSKSGKSSPDSFVGNKKPPKVSNAKSSKNSFNPRYLQATESSFR